MNKVLYTAKIIFTRMFVFYAVMYFIVIGNVDLKKIRTNVTVANLNRIMPPGDYLASLIEGKAKYDAKRISEYLTYYLEVIRILPKRADAYAMAGYCYYRLGNEKKAVEYYEKAMKIDPKFFWYPYNLGIMALKRGDNEAAVSYFKTALNTNPIATMETIKKSGKIYLPILVYRVEKFNYVPEKEIDKKYRQTILFLVYIYFKQKDFEKMYTLASEAIGMNLDLDKTFLYYAAVAEHFRGHPKESILYLRQFLEEYPDRADAYVYLALNFQELGEEQTAKSLLLTAQRFKDKKDILNIDTQALTLEPY